MTLNNAHHFNQRHRANKLVYYVLTSIALLAVLSEPSLLASTMIADEDSLGREVLEEAAASAFLASQSVDCTPLIQFFV